MAVDKRLVTRKIALILEDLKDLERVAGLSRPDFLSDRLQQLIAERLLERIVGRMIDINYHLITERTGLPPKDFHESFTKLGTLRVIPAELGRALAPAAGLRNRLAHEYNEIDYEKLHAALADTFGKVPQYLQAVERFLASLTEEPES